MGVHRSSVGNNSSFIELAQLGDLFFILEHSLFILEVGRRTRSSFELPGPQVQVWGNDGSAPSPAPTNQVPNS